MLAVGVQGCILCAVVGFGLWHSICILCHQQSISRVVFGDRQLVSSVPGEWADTEYNWVMALSP